jgi:hypothetical protein
VPKAYPREFRDDVVRVARNREPGQHLRPIAADFGGRSPIVGPVASRCCGS